MFDWDYFSSLDTSTPVGVSLNEQQIQLILSALALLEREEFENDDSDTRDAVLSELIYELEN